MVDENGVTQLYPVVMPEVYYSDVDDGEGGYLTQREVAYQWLREQPEDLIKTVEKYLMR